MSRLGWILLVTFSYLGLYIPHTLYGGILPMFERIAEAHPGHLVRLSLLQNSRSEEVTVSAWQE